MKCEIPKIVLVKSKKYLASSKSEKRLSDGYNCERFEVQKGQLALMRDLLRSEPTLIS
jgi:hypothetical protein